MNSPAGRRAFVELLQLERELEAIAADVFTMWLDQAVPATLPGGLTAAAEQPEEEEGTIPPDVAALVAAAVVWESLVDTELLPRIGGVLDRLTAPFTRRLASWRTTYLASIRERLLGAPNTAVRTVTATVQQARTTGASVGRMRAAARGALSFARAGASWAAGVGRTEAASMAAATREQLATVAEHVATTYQRQTDTPDPANAPTAEEVNAAAAILPPGRGQLVKVWASMRDDRVRETHQHADGQRRPIGDKFWVGGFDMTGPGDPFAPIDETAGCRCVLVLDRDTGAQVASFTPVGGTGMRTFRAQIIPLGQFGRTQGWMLGSTVELVDTVLPQAMKWQKTAVKRHEGAYTVAAIESLAVEEGWLVGYGTWLDTPEAAEAAAEVEAGVTRPSVELVGRTEVMTDAAGNPIPMETADVLAASGERVGMRIDVAEIVATTLVSVPEFRDASVTFGDTTEQAAPALSLVAASVVEPTYDESLFDDPLLDGPTPIHLTDDGRVIGHLATRGTCHVGYKDRCVEPPRSKTGYAYFHQSSVKLTSGDRLAVGRLTIGGGHAKPGIGVAAATEHYDNIATCWAKVRAGEDEHGTWVAGIVDPDAPEDMVRKALGTPHSGHWEPVGGNPEMIAACGVNTPGFPIVQAARTKAGDYALVASFAPRQSFPTVDTSILDDVALRAVKAYTEEQANRERADHARRLVASMSTRRRTLADAIRDSHARRKAS